MGRRTRGKWTTLIVVLVLTVGLVAVLSAATHDSSQKAADRYIQQTQAQTAQEAGLFAPAKGRPEIPALLSLAGFLMILAIPVAAYLCIAKVRRNTERAAARRRSRRELRNAGVRYRV